MATAPLLSVLIDNAPDQPNLHISPGAVIAAAERAGLDSVAASEATGVGVTDAEILITGRATDVAALRLHAPKLRWVQTISAGVDKLLPWLPTGVTLTNASGVHAEKAGEFVLAAALMLNFDIPRFVSDQREQRWAPIFGGPIVGRRATLLGVGAIGHAAAMALRLHGVNVTGVGRGPGPREDWPSYAAMADVDRLLPETDLLVSSLPLTHETRGLLDRKRLKVLPQGAGVIVVGRADVLDYEALVDLLSSGHLGGAVLDVFPNEPPPAGDRLWSCPRLIMTPHCSLDDHSAYLERCLALFGDNLRRYVAGEPLRNRVDPAAGY